MPNASVLFQAKAKAAQIKAPILPSIRSLAVLGLAGLGFRVKGRGFGLGVDGRGSYRGLNVSFADFFSGFQHVIPP